MLGHYISSTRHIIWKTQLKQMCCYYFRYSYINRSLWNLYEFQYCGPFNELSNWCFSWKTLYMQLSNLVSIIGPYMFKWTALFSWGILLVCLTFLNYLLMSNFLHIVLLQFPSTQRSTLTLHTLQKNAIPTTHTLIKGHKYLAENGTGIKEGRENF